MIYLLYISPLLLFACTSPTKSSYSDNRVKNDSVITENTTQESNDPEDFIESAEKFKFKNASKNIEEDTLLLTNGDIKYVIFPTGLLEIDNTESIQLTDLNIERAFLYSDVNYIYVFFTDTDYESSTSWITKIRKSDLQREYTNQIEGFNLGLPIIHDTKVYVNALGFIGRIELETGEYDWKTEDLYDNEKYSFNSFDTVLINQSTVGFLSRNYKSGHEDKIVVNKDTGELIDLIK